jgi:uncharacterized protein (TIRG00374 family)
MQGSNLQLDGIRIGGRWRIAIGLIASAACVVLLLWLIDWRHAVAAVGNMDMRWVALAPLLLLGCYVTFAVRWWLLLRCDPALPPLRLFAVLTMGLAVSATLPLRPGDALRAYLIGHVYGGGISRAVGSIVLERILDVATVLFLGGIAGLAVQLPESMRGMLIGMSILIAVAVATVFTLATVSGLVISILIGMADASRYRWTRFIAHQVAKFARALTVSGSQLTLAAIASVIGWAFYSAAMIACGVAFSIPAPVIGGLLMAVLTNVGGMIPSSPGSVGVYHAFAVLALSATGTSQELALAVAVVSHALIIAIQLVLGVVAFASVSGTVRSSIMSKRLEKPLEGT